VVTRQQTNRKQSGKNAPGKRKKQDPNALTDRQRHFILAYEANGHNGARAYMALHPGANAGTAATEAYRTLRKPHVSKELDRRRQERWQRLEMTAEEAAALVAIRARADIGQAFDENGVMLPVTMWPEELRLAVKSIKPGPYGDTITLHDGLRACELVLQMAGKLKQVVALQHFDHVGYLASKSEGR